jgi:Tol biopolymer transport system component
MAIEAHDGPLTVVAVDGSSVRELAMTLGGGLPAWSPDSRRIAYDHPDGGVSMVDIATGVSTRITTDRGTSPRWSPDGDRLAYVLPTGSDRAAYVIVDLDDPSTTRLELPVTAPEVMAGPPLWAPDGRALLGGADGVSADPGTSIIRFDLTGNDEPAVFEGIAPSWQRSVR